MIHQNSIAAIQSERDAGNLSKRESLIIAALEGATRWNGSMTDREILEATGFRDMNSVRPRITEMVKRKVLEEVGSVRDPDTAKLVRLVRIKKPAVNLELFG